MLFFKVNQEYDRTELLDFVGSKQGQSGIIYGPKEPSCVIVTSGGRHGKNAGYTDRKNLDDTWNYIGQGSKGDQNPYSAANSLLSSMKRNVLLFTTREPSARERAQQGNGNKRYKFEGIFDVLSWSMVDVKEGERVGDKLIDFHLIPTNNVFNDFEVEVIEHSTQPNLLEDILAKIKRAAPKDKEEIKKYTTQEYHRRSKLIRDYALIRANGICELCNNKAPFSTLKGFPFLEVHHILKLADDGPDEPANVAALCPNCHRESHFGANKDLLKARLVERMLQLERVSKN